MNTMADHLMAELERDETASAAEPADVPQSSADWMTNPAAATPPPALQVRQDSNGWRVAGDQLHLAVICAEPRFRQAHEDLAVAMACMEQHDLMLSCISLQGIPGPNVQLLHQRWRELSRKREAAVATINQLGLMSALQLGLPPDSQLLGSENWGFVFVRLNPPTAVNPGATRP